MNRKPKQQLESGIKRAVREFLCWHKWSVFQIQQGPFGTPGISDLIAIRDKRVLFLEIKTPAGKVSEDQKRFARGVHEQGIEYHVIRDVDDLRDLGVI